jgi:hypothetical protein
MADETIVNTDDTGTGTESTGNDTQVESSKTFTQEELNDIVAKRVAQVKNKYSEIDPNEYNALRQFKESIEEEQLMKRQDFEGVLKKTKDKYGQEISSLRTELERIKVDGALINAASKNKAIAPEQVAKLLKEQVRLDDKGNVLVMDGDSPRYNDNAEPMTVDQLVEEFLNSNQFFKSAGPSGTGSQSNTETANQQEFDIAKLDMNNPEHRAKYKQMMKQGKI